MKCHFGDERRGCEIQFGELLLKQAQSIFSSPSAIPSGVSRPEAGHRVPPLRRWHFVFFTLPSYWRIQSNPLHPHFCLQPCTQGMCRCLKELFLLRFNRLRLSGCLKSFHLNLFKWRITGLSHHRFLIQILERALYQSILFSQNVSQNLFDQNQSGFKSVCSTETVLLCVVLCSSMGLLIHKEESTSII